jgi:hypothetical protein
MLSREQLVRIEDILEKDLIDKGVQCVLNIFKIHYFGGIMRPQIIGKYFIKSFFNSHSQLVKIQIDHFFVP